MFSSVEFNAIKNAFPMKEREREALSLAELFIVYRNTCILMMIIRNDNQTPMRKEEENPIRHILSFLPPPSSSSCL